MFLILLKREFKLLYKKKAELLQLLVFLLLAFFILPLAVGPDIAALAPVIGGYIWIIELFMIFQSLKLFFDDDYRDGSLEQFFLQIPSRSCLVMAKYAACSLNLILISLLALPFLGILFQIGPEALIKIVLSLIIGIPCLGVIGGFGASVTLGSKKASMVIPVILIPLYIPVLIFAVSSASPGNAGFYDNIAILAAFLLFAAPLSIYFSTLALEIAIKE